MILVLFLVIAMAISAILNYLLNSQHLRIYSTFDTILNGLLKKLVNLASNIKPKFVACTVRAIVSICENMCFTLRFVMVF